MNPTEARDTSTLESEGGVDTLPTDARTHVLLVITKSNWGGAQRYVYDLATGLDPHTYSVTVAFGQEGPLGDHLRNAGIPTHSITELARDVSLRADWAAFRALLLLLATERPDVLHLNSSKIGILGALAGRLHNIREWHQRKQVPARPVRILFTGHGWAFNEDRPGWQRILIGFLHWLTVILSHQTIAVSHATRDDIARLPFLSHKLTVIHNGIAKSPTPLTRTVALHALLLPPEWEAALADEANTTRPLLVGSIAELHPNKGISFALTAIHELVSRSERPIWYVVIAGGQDEAKLSAQIEELGLADRVRLLGYRKNAATLLPAFDIFLLPSITEAMPYVILEAGSAGLPIVATAVGGIPEVIEDMKTGILLQPRNPNEIARAIEYLAAETGRRETLAQRAEARIGERFSLAEMIERTSALYHPH